MGKFYYLKLRFLLIIVISMVAIICDVKLDLFSHIKKYTLNFTDLSYYLYDKPCLMFDLILKILKGYKEIILENYILQQELLLKQSELLLLEQCQQENFRLRGLIYSEFLSCNQKKVITRVIFINADPWHNHIVINKGRKHDVYVGQPVITEKGIVGQVISVNACSSNVLLIHDIKHALSVQVRRNSHRMILFGRGYNMKLYAECPTNIDICIGDMLITSGLDGLFPEGYPVAIVSDITINEAQDIMVVHAHPTVNFQCLRDILLIWK